MIYLHSLRKYFQIIGIMVFDCNRLAAVMATAKFLICFIMMGPFAAYMSSRFIYLHLNDLANATVALADIVACTTMSPELLFLKWQQKNIGKLIMNFQEIIDNGGYCLA